MIEVRRRIQRRASAQRGLSRLEAAQTALIFVGCGSRNAKWWLNRTTEGLHLMVSPYHLQIVDVLLGEIRTAVETVQRTGVTSQDKDASYSGTARRT